jgi:hypothetical protein
MTPAEVFYRVQEVGRKRVSRLLGQRRRRFQSTDAMPAAGRWLRMPAALNKVHKQTSLIIIAAETARIMAGEVRLFATSFYSVGRVPEWNRCPLTGVLAAAVPSHTISLTDRAQVGDIKFVWELNRHLHWVTLAQAHALDGAPEPLQVLGEQLRSWLQQCPPNTGPNWTSSLEYALRLINWSVVWQLIDGERSSLFSGAEGQALLRNWLEVIQHHVLGIAEHYSRHSSANNHLIGELAGVFVSAHTWPCWPLVRALGKRARHELEQQIVLQTTEDGVNREQAFEYAAFVFDFFVVVERCAAMVSQPMSAAYLDRMAAMCCFIRSVMDSGGHVPQVGDADGARVLRLHPDGSHAGFAAMLQKGALLFGRPDWVGGLGEQGANEAQWLYASLDEPAASTKRQPRLDFPEGGYQLFESAVGTSREIKGLVDVGPLGYLGIAAHGHADALQLCLSVGGRPLLVDPGTYSYWSDKPSRDYFRGTSAHNTVRVAEQDQSASGGRFMWTRKAVVCDVDVQRRVDGSAQISASHDGYQRLRSAFGHHRRVEFDATALTVLVIDEVAGMVDECIELHWHIHPDWDASLGNAGLMLRLGEQAVLLEVRAMNTEGELSLWSAVAATTLAWYSDRYNIKRASKVLRWRGHGRAANLRTLITIR